MYDNLCYSPFSFSPYFPFILFAFRTPIILNYWQVIFTKIVGDIRMPLLPDAEGVRAQVDVIFSFAALKMDGSLENIHLFSRMKGSEDKTDAKYKMYIVAFHDKSKQCVHVNIEVLNPSVKIENLLDNGFTKLDNENYVL